MNHEAQAHRGVKTIGLIILAVAVTGGVVQVFAALVGLSTSATVIVMTLLALVVVRLAWARAAK